MISFIFIFSSVDLSIAIITPPFVYTDYITLRLILSSFSIMMYITNGGINMASDIMSMLRDLEVMTNTLLPDADITKLKIRYEVIRALLNS